MSHGDRHHSKPPHGRNSHVMHSPDTGLVASRAKGQSEARSLILFRCKTAKSPASHMGHFSVRGNDRSPSSHVDREHTLEAIRTDLQARTGAR